MCYLQMSTIECVHLPCLGAVLVLYQPENGQIADRWDLEGLGDDPIADEVCFMFLCVSSSS